MWTRDMDNFEFGVPGERGCDSQPIIEANSPERGASALMLPDHTLLDRNNVWARRYKLQLFETFRQLTSEELTNKIITAAKLNDVTMLTLLLKDYEETESQIDSFDDAVQMLATEGNEGVVNKLIDQFGADVNAAAYGYILGKWVGLLNLHISQYENSALPVDMETVANAYVQTEQFAAAEMLVANRQLAAEDLIRVYRENGLMVRAKALKDVVTAMDARDRLQKLVHKYDESDGASIIKSTKKNCFQEVYANLNRVPESTPSFRDSGFLLFKRPVNMSNDLDAVNADCKRIFGGQ